MSRFKKAERAGQWLRLMLTGPAGAGKTYTGLSLALGLDRGPVAVIDTEHGSASKYGDLWDYDVLELTHFAPRDYLDAMREAYREGYRVLLIDSLAHVWIGEGGALDMADKASERYQGNSFAAWKDVTPAYRSLWDGLLKAPMHIIATCRTKTAYEVQKDDRGKVKPVKVGLAPQLRDGSEYEMDIVCQLDPKNNIHIDKTRCSVLAGKTYRQPAETAAFVGLVRDWIGDEPEALEEEEPEDGPIDLNSLVPVEPELRFSGSRWADIENEEWLLTIADREDLPNHHVGHALAQLWALKSKPFTEDEEDEDGA